MTNPKVSVIIPVYNVEQYLREAVDSVLRQTFTDFEIILVDDGSIDASGKICDEYAAADSRIRVIHKTNGGLSSARNAGLQSAKGTFVVFLDSDDYWLSSNLLEKALQAHDRYPDSDYVQFQFLSFNDGNRPQLPLANETTSVFSNPKDIIKAYERHFISRIACDKVYRLSSIPRTLLFPDGVYYEDERFNTELLCDIKQVVVASCGYYAYRIRNGSITHIEFGLKHACDLFEKDFHGMKVTKALPEAESLYVSYCINCLREYCNVILLGGEDCVKKYNTQIRQFLLSYSQLWQYRRHLDRSIIVLSLIIKTIGTAPLSFLLKSKA